MAGRSGKSSAKNIGRMQGLSEMGRHRAGQLSVDEAAAAAGARYGEPQVLWPLQDADDPAPAFTSLLQVPGCENARLWGQHIVRDYEAFSQGLISWSHAIRFVVLHGLSGNGKTLLPAVLARHLNIKRLRYSCVQLLGAGREGDVIAAVRGVSEAVTRTAGTPPCVLVLDDLELTGTPVSGADPGGLRLVLAAALRELIDELRNVERVIVVGVAADLGLVDQALLSASRLDRPIEFTPPTVKDLSEILKYYLETGAEHGPKGVFTAAQIEVLTQAMEGATAAEVERLARDARRIARRAGNSRLSIDHVFQALRPDGPELPEEHLYRFAVHEIGHAAAAIAFGVSREGTVSLVETAARVGRTSTPPRFACDTREMIEAQIAVCYAGRAAERVVLGAPAADAQGAETNDVIMATDLAIDLVLGYDMSDCQIRAAFSKEHRKPMLLAIPEAREGVRRILGAAESRAATLVRDHRDGIVRAAKELLARKGLSFAEVALLAGLGASQPRCG